MASWGSERSKILAAVNTMTSGSRGSAASLQWLIEQTAKLPLQDEPARRLHELVQADIALRSYKARPHAVQEMVECVFPGRVRRC